MHKRWNICKLDTPEIKAFAAELGVSDILAGLLWQRGIREANAARKFLYPETEQEFFDPFLMRDMETAVKFIGEAIENEKQITVYGDYDVDGITATSLLVKNFRLLGAKVDYYIPDRVQEGYGLNVPAMQRLKENGTDLIVSVDCGIAAGEEITAAEGIPRLIVTDHHLPGENLPQALAVVDPHRRDCPYPDKNLAGVGVAFKLCQALWLKLKNEEFLRDYDIVALGTIADIVPLIGENRKLVRLGLKELSHSKNCGIQALVEVAGLYGKEINSGQVGFGLAPRLNAAGRIGSAMDGVKLLLSSNMRESRPMADALHDANTERQSAERKILALAEELLAKEDMSKLHSIVLSGENWHSGVIGIVASRLVDKYYLPTVIICKQGEVAKGSCRSIKGLNIYEALEHCRDTLITFGGHSQAAGLTVAPDKIERFREEFDRYVAETLPPEAYEPTVNIEFELSPSKLDLALVKELNKLEPYGMGNPKPMFGYRRLQGVSARTIGREGQHLSLQVNGRSGTLTLIAWDKGEFVDVVATEPIDIVYAPQVDEWQGRMNLECIIHDFTVSSQLFPDRQILVQIYTMLKHLQDERGRIPDDPCLLTMQFFRCAGAISYYTMESGLKVFEELGIIKRDAENSRYLLPPQTKKFDLNDSALYRKHNSSPEK